MFLQNLRLTIGFISWTGFLECCNYYTNNLRVHAYTADMIWILKGFRSAIPLCSNRLWDGGVDDI